MEEQENQQPKATETRPVAKKKSPVVSILTTIIIIAIAGAIGFFLMGGKDENNKTVDTTTNNSTVQTTTDNPEQKSTAQTSDMASAPTKEQVALHNKQSDCWTIVEGVVYDITEYIPKHPGGESILEACGTDGTSLFAERKTADGQKVGSGTPHSNRAEGMLKEYEVGKLAN